MRGFNIAGASAPVAPAVPTPLVDCTCRSDAVRDLDCSSRGGYTHESEEADTVDARSTAAEETHDGEHEAQDDEGDRDLVDDDDRSSLVIDEQRPQRQRVAPDVIGCELARRGVRRGAALASRAGRAARYRKRSVSSRRSAYHANKSCVQLPTYANNVALPAFARRCCSDISCPPGPQQQTNRQTTRSNK